jgi:epoxyqueuosine reductase
MSLTAQIFDKAHGLGFDLVGIARVHPVPHLDVYHSWIAQGYHGEMGYMARPDRVERREDPGKIVPSARSVICVGLNYYSDPLPAHFERHPSCGLISNYAWGMDYHDLMMPRLESLAAFIGAEAGAETGCNVTCRAYVDTGPVLERAYAARAGLGFIGKNTCLIHPRMGSWLFLGEILVDVELDPAMEQMSTSCGTCRRCLDACPTGALVAPYVLDARRCISYLTIELKGSIPCEFRSLMSNWIYGCDICQVVCPWQRFAQPTREQSFWADGPDRAAPALQDLMGMGEDVFQQRYKGSPIFRVGRRRLLRNTAVALGNWGNERAVPALICALTDVEPLIRGHAAWALGHIGGRAAQNALENSLHGEQDSCVQREIEMAVSASSHRQM